MANSGKGWLYTEALWGDLILIWSIMLILFAIAVAHKFTIWKSAIVYFVFFVLPVIFVLIAAYSMANYEIIRRAQAAYEKGENLFAIKHYKEAMWDYQEVQEFYDKPHNQWLELAEEKEWICRAYLNDWVPSEGPLNIDVENCTLTSMKSTRQSSPKLRPCHKH